MPIATKPGDFLGMMEYLRGKTTDKPKIPKEQMKEMFMCMLSGNEWVNGRCVPRVVNSLEGKMQLTFHVVPNDPNFEIHLGKRKFAWIQPHLKFPAVECDTKVSCYAGIQGRDGVLRMWDKNGAVVETTGAMGLPSYQDHVFSCDFSPLVLDQWICYKFKGLDPSELADTKVYVGFTDTNGNVYAVGFSWDE